MAPASSGRGRRRGLIALASAILLIGVTLIAVSWAQPRHSSAPAPAAPAPATALATTAPATAAAAGLPPSEPVNLSIPAIGVNHAVGTVGLNPDRTIEVPPLTDVALPAWYRYSPTPGQPGPAVFVGHVDSRATKGVFYDLGKLKAGDRIIVARADHTTVTFAVASVTEYPKSAFPTQAVYGDTPGPELRLITCGGAYDAAAHNYLDNIVVYARITP